MEILIALKQANVAEIPRREVNIGWFQSHHDLSKNLQRITIEFKSGLRAGRSITTAFSTSKTCFGVFVVGKVHYHAEKWVLPLSMLEEQESLDPATNSYALRYLLIIRCKRRRRNAPTLENIQMYWARFVHFGSNILPVPFVTKGDFSDFS